MQRSKISQVIETHVKQGRAQRARWARYSRWYHAEKTSYLDDAPYVGSSGEDESEDLTLEANYVYSYLDTMAANICPSNPQVDVLPHDEEMKDYALNRESLINYNFNQVDMADKLHTGTIQAGLKGFGVFKTVWDEEKKRAEVRVVPSENFFFDASGEFEDAGYVIEATPIKESEFQRRAGLREGTEDEAIYDKEAAEKVTADSYPAWMRQGEGRRAWSRSEDASYSSFKWVLVYEVYDFDERKFYHFADGVKEPLYEGELPYMFVDNPYDVLIFNKSFHDSRGLSDIQLIEPVLERLNEIDTLELHHTLRSIPIMAINKAAFDSPGAATDALLGATNPGDAISVSLRPGYTINDAVGWSLTPSLSPHFESMRGRMTGLIEFVLGMPAYMRGDMGDSKVATEFALVDTATRTRNGTRSRRLNKVIKSVSKKFMGLWKEELMPQNDEDGSVVSKSVRIVGETSVSTLVPQDLDILPPSGDDPYEYLTVAYSPTENHRMIQMQKLQQTYPILVNNPIIDQQKLFDKIFELLGMESLVSDEPQAPAMPEGMTDGTQTAPTEDTIAGGGTPGGADSAMVDGLSPMADGPVPDPII